MKPIYLVASSCIGSAAFVSASPLPKGGGWPIFSGFHLPGKTKENNGEGHHGIFGFFKSIFRRSLPATATNLQERNNDLEYHLTKRSGGVRPPISPDAAYPDFSSASSAAHSLEPEAEESLMARDQPVTPSEIDSSPPAVRRVVRRDVRSLEIDKLD